MSDRERVAVAMSGGVDSSVAAALLVDQGLDVVGFTAHMWKDGSRCCSIEDVQQARKISWFLGIRHFTLNASGVFNRDVVDSFVAEYLRGRTPSPCVICNRTVKFGFLLTRALQLKCSALATGHYARIESDDDHYRLLRGVDGGKDQSYFLHRLSQQQLGHILFPLGNWTKQEALDYARSRGLPLGRREESQDVCFVADGDYSRFVEARAPAARAKGSIVDRQGNVMGRHEGIHRYTVGQRKGLGIASTEPLYVTRLDPAKNQVEVGRREEAMSATCMLDDVHWVAGGAPDCEREYELRIRYRHGAAAAKLAEVGENRFRADFATPQFAVTPGQAGVVYDGDEVLGGGWIASPHVSEE